MQFQVSLLYGKFSSVLSISNEEEQSEVTRAAEEIEFDDCSKGLGKSLSYLYIVLLYLFDDCSEGHVKCLWIDLCESNLMTVLKVMVSLYLIFILYCCMCLMTVLISCNLLMQCLCMDLCIRFDDCSKVLFSVYIMIYVSNLMTVLKSYLVFTQWSVYQIWWFF